MSVPAGFTSQGIRITKEKSFRTDRLSGIVALGICGLVSKLFDSILCFFILNYFFKVELKKEYSF